MQSSRGPVGVTGRADLFSPRSQPPAETLEVPLERRDHQQEDSRQPLALDRVIGFNPTPQGLLAHPLEAHLFVKSMGALVSVESLEDCRLQRLLRAHDMPVTALAVSPAGSLIASGQEGSQHVKGFAAPVFVWHLISGRRVAVLKGLTGRANAVVFSPDERFVLACDENCLLLIWDLASSEVICGHRSPSPVTVVTWVDYAMVNRDPVYRLAVGAGSSLHLASLAFQRARMQWLLELAPFAMPPSAGMVRAFRSIAACADNDCVFVGTSGGEVLTFKLSARIFRSCSQVCKNGATSLLSLAPESLLVGGGDGSLIILGGGEFDLRRRVEARVEGGVVSLSLCANGIEALVGTAAGRYYRCLLTTLACSEVGVSPLDGVSAACAASADPSESVFVSASESGELRLWDLTDYGCLAAVKLPRCGRIHAVSCADVEDRSLVVVASEDGSVRCFDRFSLTRQLWSIPEAHKRGTLCLALSTAEGAQFMVTGGGDGIVRVWLLRNRELIVQFSEHRREIVAVLVDDVHPNIIHSAAGDGVVVSFDLRTGRRLISHSIVGGSALRCMAQRRDSEHELLVTDARGRVFALDIDQRDPVATMQEASGSQVHCTAISPSGAFLAIGGARGLAVVHVKSGAVVCEGEGHSGVVSTVLWTPDGSKIITGGSDACICIWHFNLNSLI